MEYSYCRSRTSRYASRHQSTSELLYHSVLTADCTSPVPLPSTIDMQTTPVQAGRNGHSVTARVHRDHFRQQQQRKQQTTTTTTQPHKRERKNCAASCTTIPVRRADVTQSGGNTIASLLAGTERTMPAVSRKKCLAAPKFRCFLAEVPAKLHQDLLHTSTHNTLGMPTHFLYFHGLGVVAFFQFLQKLELAPTFC